MKKYITSWISRRQIHLFLQIIQYGIYLTWRIGRLGLGLEIKKEFLQFLLNEKISFILLPKSATREIEAYIASAVERGEMELLFTETRWKPYAMYRVIDPGN